MPDSPAPCGFLLVDKPAGPTSHDVVEDARKRLHTMEIGHTGTLDPPATGLLVLAIGRATAVLQFLDWDKAYRGTARLGVETDTLDATGRVVASRPVTCNADQAAAAFRALAGTRRQRAPMVSAVKVKGKRLHVLARQGKVVDRPERVVTVHRAEVVRVALPDVEFDADVSSGTYVRVLAEEAGRALGCGAHLRALRRTRVGPFRVEDAMKPSEIDASRLRPPAEALAHLPEFALEEGQAQAVSHGRAVRWAGSGLVRMTFGGKLVAVGEGDGKVAKPRRVFPEGL
ncbi:MAG: tRNA pseudouridine(55) synthase TruB [Planctomycetia bacterium]|nr:tRNA pseudouridine(55) synthase TruB [Planctomycetia bacterium]